MSSPIKLIAFYLPQIHPIPEDDIRRDKGLTEWTNVTNARPLFPEHYQPHLPAYLDSYDLNITEIREQQAALAKEYGIYGFCYYYHYCSGKNRVQLPMNLMIESGKPDFPFCVCWANENWAHGTEDPGSEILLGDKNSDNPDEKFIKSLLPAFKDKRYIRINGKMLLLVSRVDSLPDPMKSAAIWKETVKKELDAELYLCAMNGCSKKIDPDKIGFDATVQFPLETQHALSIDAHLFALRQQIDPEALKGHQFFDYQKVADYMTGLPKPDYKFFRGVFPSYDNSSKIQAGAKIFFNSSPENFKLFLRRTINLTLEEQQGDEKLIFLNAWNDWADGAHLEPDQKYGLKWLESIRETLVETGNIKQIAEDIRSKYKDDVDLAYALDKLEMLFNEKEEALISSRNECSKLLQGNNSLNFHLDMIKKSWTFRFGQLILWIPTRILRLFKR